MLTCLGVTELTPSGSSNMATPSGFSSSYEVIVEKRSPRMPCYIRTIDRNPNFVGREAIVKKLDESLLPGELGSSGLRSFCLYGFGGLGKTQIATYYAF